MDAILAPEKSDEDGQAGQLVKQSDGAAETAGGDATSEVSLRRVAYQPAISDTAQEAPLSSSNNANAEDGAAHAEVGPDQGDHFFEPPEKLEAFKKLVTDGIKHDNSNLLTDRSHTLSDYQVQNLSRIKQEIFEEANILEQASNRQYPVQQSRQNIQLKQSKLKVKTN